MPHVGIDFGQRNAGFIAIVVNEAEVNCLGKTGKNCKVRAGAVIRRTKWVGFAGPDTVRRRGRRRVFLFRHRGHLNGNYAKTLFGYRALCQG